MYDYSHLLTKRQRVLCSVASNIFCIAGGICLLIMCGSAYDWSRLWFAIPGIVFLHIGERINYWKKYHYAPQREKDAYNIAYRNGTIKMIIYAIFFPIVIFVLAFGIFFKKSFK